MGLGIFDGKVEQNPDGVGFLPLILPLVAAPTIYTGYKALQAARSVAAAASAASGDALQPTVDSFKACANQLAVKSGYRAVPAGPLLAKTCGLAVDPVSTGCPSRDYLIQTCNERKITPEPLAKMTVSEAEAAAEAADEEEEETGVSGFLRSKTALYLGATVIGVLVLVKMRRNARKTPVKNPRRRQRRNPRPFRYNQPDYKYYVLIGKKIDSGWEFKDDAEDWKREIGATAVVRSKAAVKRMGVDLNDNKNWLTGPEMDRLVPIRLVPRSR